MRHFQKVAWAGAVAFSALLAGCGSESSDSNNNTPKTGDTTVNLSGEKIVGSWQKDSFDPTAPKDITFFANGYYTAYELCSLQEDPDPNAFDMEMGTYGFTDNVLTIKKHLRNGCGGFNDDGDGVMPPVDVTFNDDGTSMGFAGHSFAKAIDSSSPVVGGWVIDKFDPANPETVTFFKNGYYIVHSDCAKQPEPDPDEDLEIGTYTYNSGVLTITSHFQNGCGGFDNDENTDVAGALNVTFSGGNATMTLTDHNLTLTRVK